MAKTPVPRTSLSEEQRAEAYARFELLRPALEEGVSQAQIARTHKLSKSAVQRWVARYREQGLAGLVTTARKDKGKSRRLPQQAITLVEGLALQSPPRSAAAIHRQVAEIAKAQGWKPPSYERLRQIIKSLDPALVTLAHPGSGGDRASESHHRAGLNRDSLMICLQTVGLEKHIVPSRSRSYSTLADRS